MRESATCFHNVEWPPEGARLVGPTVWLRGWIVGRANHDFTDVRVRHAGRTHLGVLGLPRVDLAAHFKSARPWLPAEFILGVPAADGPAALTLEARDAHGAWHPLQTVTVTVATDGTPPPQVEGRLEDCPDGTWTVRDAHHPFHGHLDEPGPAPRLRHGRAAVFGWLLDETRPLAGVLATTDTLVFNHLDHSQADAALAARVQHPGAGRARLRGAVDCPDTLTGPICLRVYALSPDGAARLCFARRFEPAALPVAPQLPPATLTPVTPHSLPALPSGRPRRLLLVMRSLLPNDSTLRALDLARHLVASERWAARLVAAEDGPLRHDFLAAGVEALVVDPKPLLEARDEVGVASALQGLERQIWWRHLDAVAVFDPVCGWAITLARRQEIPVLFDCTTTEPVEPDATASPAVQQLQRDSWRAATTICFGTHAAACAQHDRLGNPPAEIIPQWHTPGLAVANPAARRVFAPLRTIAWMVRHHPEVAARWEFCQGPAGEITEDQLAQQDEALNCPAVQRTPDWSVAGTALCLGPLFGRGPLRPVIDAAAAGIPVLAPRGAATEEFFQPTHGLLVNDANPAALAHALLAWSALPASFQREAAALSPAFRSRHDPARLLAQWERLLATTAHRG